MIALSIFYAFADLILLLQILMYNRKNALKSSAKVDPSHLSPATPLLESFEDEEDSDQQYSYHTHHNHHHNQNNTPNNINTTSANRSLSNGSALSDRTVGNTNPDRSSSNSTAVRTTSHGTMELDHDPVRKLPVPSPISSKRNRSRRLNNPDLYNTNSVQSPISSSSCSINSSFSENSVPPMSLAKTILFNTSMVICVFAAGVAGWVFSERRHPSVPTNPDEPQAPLELDFWGQIFGWGCAILYLGSRFPQILLNFKRKSVEGISFLFFLFACLGNLTYVISILVLDLSPKYLLINASWLAGSVGTLFLDMIIFTQFWIYNRPKNDDDYDEEDEYDYSSDEEVPTN